jgi:hypothetical protein
MDKLESAELTKAVRRTFTQAVWIAVQQAQAAGLAAEAINERLLSIASDVLVDEILDRQAARGSVNQD